MRIVFLIGILLAASGCAIHRDVTFIFYPNAPHKETFPRQSEFYAEAEKECAKYGCTPPMTGTLTRVLTASE